MPEFLAILLKINLVLVLFAATYYLVLRRLTFYSINRLFLAMGILFSTAYPFIDLTDFFHNQKQINVAFVPGLNQKVNHLVPAEFVAIHWQVISIVFYAGVCLMAARLAIQFFSLYLMHKKSKPGKVNEYAVRILEEAVSPFSFWQNVYVNPRLHGETELKTILAHEQVHVKQWHSLDILLAELSVVFYWFNPGVWLMKKAVKENLEFITDQKILNNGVDRKTYQYSLLDVGNLTPAVAIVNNFNLSDLKKRIQMMNVKRSSRITLSRYLLVTPILLITTLAFTISKKDIKRHLIPVQEVLSQHHLLTDIPPAEQSLGAKINHAKKQGRSVLGQRDTVRNLSGVFKAIFVTADSAKAIRSGVEIQSPAQAALKKYNFSDSGLKVVRFVRGVKIGDEEQAAYAKNIQDLNSRLKGKVLVERLDITGSELQGPVGNGQPETRITIRGKGVSSDSLSLSTASFFLDGKKMTAEDLKKLNANEIKTVNVSRKGPNDAIIVIGRKAQ